MKDEQPPVKTKTLTRSLHPWKGAYQPNWSAPSDYKNTLETPGYKASELQWASPPPWQNMPLNLTEVQVAILNYYAHIIRETIKIQECW